MRNDHTCARHLILQDVQETKYERRTRANRERDQPSEHDSRETLPPRSLIISRTTGTALLAFAQAQTFRQRLLLRTKRTSRGNPNVPHFELLS